MPTRVQRKRTKGWKMPPNTVYVGRPSKYGNPFTFRDALYDSAGEIRKSVDENIIAAKESNDAWVKYAYAILLENYRKWITEKLRADPEFLTPLRERDLACWCPLDQPCHADVLLTIANEERP